MKKIKIVAPLSWFILVTVVILGIGVVIGGVVNQYVFNLPEAAPQQIQSWPLPPTMEELYRGVPVQNTLDDYYLAAFDQARELALYLDIAYPGAKVIWEQHGGFSSKEEIANFLTAVQFGSCRHRVAYAYWFLHALYPTSDIRAVVGYVYVPCLVRAEEGEVRIIWGDSRYALDSNHAWLLIDGEIFDPSLDPQRVRYYHPYAWCYYLKEIEVVDGIPIITHITFPRYDIYREEVEEQFRYDKGLTRIPREDIPPWWYQEQWYQGSGVS